MNKGISKVKRRKKYRKIWSTVLTVLVVSAIISAVLLTGTDASAHVINDYGKVKDIEYDIEKTDYGYKLIDHDDDGFRILQLTDIHIGGGILSISNDKMALTAVAEVVNAVKPDLIIVTGDIAYPVPFQSGTLNNLRAAKIFADLMSQFKIPWTITFGNHDTERYSLYDREAISNFYSQLEGCLFTPGPEDVFGYGNHIITLHNSSGELYQAIVMLDSNSYIEGNVTNKYDIIHDDQLDWYEESIRKLSEGREALVPSLMFFHIPFKEFNDAYNLYSEGDESVTYYYGVKNEKVAASPLDCNTFERIVSLGSTKGVFVGHDHVNDFSIEYEGVRLTYGKSIDYLAYAWSGIIRKTEQRGGTIIEVKEDQSFDISTIKYVDVQNENN